MLVLGSIEDEILYEKHCSILGQSEHPTLSRIAFDGCPSKVIKKFKVDEHGNEVLVEKTVEFGKLEALKMCLKYLENKVEIDSSLF